MIDGIGPAMANTDRMKVCHIMYHDDKWPSRSGHCSLQNSHVTHYPQLRMLLSQGRKLFGGYHDKNSKQDIIDQEMPQSDYATGWTANNFPGECHSENTVL